MTEQEAATEILRRDMAAEDLIAFANAIDIPGAPVGEDEDAWIFQPIETTVAIHHNLIMSTLNKIVSGDIKRVMFFLPPGSAKSTYASVVFPSYFLGKVPGSKIILASYGSDLARRLGRRARQIVQSSAYRPIFETSISKATAAADEWALENGSEFMSGGILSGITGNRAHGLIIDDPIKGRQDADSEVIRDRTWQAYQDDLLTRLVPGGWQVIIQCMTGDTPVMMADGAQKTLDKICIGDEIATYDKGRLSSSTVKNWKNQGPDYVLAIRMKSGIIVKANGRHPFLVQKAGGLEWVRLQDLMAGQEILRTIHREEHGAEPSVLMTDVKNLQNAKVIVCPTTIKTDGEAATVRRQSIQNPADQHTSGTDTASTLKSITHSMNRRVDDVQYVMNCPLKTSGHTGAASSVLTIAKTQAKCEDSYAMTATLQSGTEKPQTCCPGPLSIYEFILDTIVDITPAGYEDVFDIQVDRTENFIANGLVSHNTRWHEDDLSGRILPADWNGESGDILCRDGNTWHVVCIQALCEREDDPIGRKIGEYLWPGWFSAEHFATFRRIPRTWSALYQQVPASEDGDYFKREWFSYYDKPPKHMTVYGCSDYAVTEGHGDSTEHGVFGLDPNGDLYVLDWWHGKTTSDVWIEFQLDLIRQFQPLVWAGEAGPIKRAIEPFLLKRMRERRDYCRLEWLTSTVDKPTRARSFQALASMGKVYLPSSKEWSTRLLSQLLRFPAGAEDDGVDVCSLMGRIMDMTYTPSDDIEEPEEYTESSSYGGYGR